MSSCAMGVLRGRSVVDGYASGEVLHSTVGLSFWGGVCPKSGTVVDRHHPLSGARLEGKILALPGGRGSCTGSQVLLELLLQEKAPAGLVLQEADEVLALGALVALELFQRRLPLLVLGAEDFAALGAASRARGDSAFAVSLRGDRIWSGAEGPDRSERSEKEAAVEDSVALSASDREMLSGAQGPARQAALSVVLRLAQLQNARRLIDVSQVHIDGCTYIGASSLRFAEKLLQWNAQVRVPTTLNAISLDLSQAEPTAEGREAAKLARAYVKMGATASFTCAPYLLDSAPRFGEQIGWGESNAVVFANSVLGARTQKYADFLDAMVAISGRAPEAGCHLDAQRKAQVVLRLNFESTCLSRVDDAFWPTLGYLCGLKSPRRVPAIVGLENVALPTRDDLKAFSAAFGTSSSAAMFHMVGVTPEAPDLQSACDDEVEEVELTDQDLAEVWQTLDADEISQVDLVALGNPHFSLAEFARLAALCENRRKDPRVTVAVTAGPQVLAASRAEGYASKLEAFGVQLVSDTCWCMLGEVVPAPKTVLPPSARSLITNSAKYAHYAPGLVKRHVRFGSLATCVDAACGTGPRPPPWLTGVQRRGHASLGFARAALRMLRR
ncbi:unnamed protein product [Effrenium voratum]|nr:unnamed protein product [Effrenium voratum]